jgi:hypothetical protein
MPSQIKSNPSTSGDETIPDPKLQQTPGASIPRSPADLMKVEEDVRDKKKKKAKTMKRSAYR